MSFESAEKGSSAEFSGPIGTWYTTKIKPVEDERVLWETRAGRVNLQSRFNRSSFGALILTNKRLLYAPNIISKDKPQFHITLTDISKVEVKSRFSDGLREIITQRAYRPRLQISLTTDEPPQLFFVPDVEGAASYINEELN